jgi:hypothetical protein
MVVGDRGFGFSDDEITLSPRGTVQPKRAFRATQRDLRHYGQLGSSDVWHNFARFLMAGTIAVVGDDEDVREILELLLEAAGHTVRPYSSGNSLCLTKISASSTA